MAYELWETTSGNLVGDFDSEAEALAAVREAAELNEPALLESLSLISIGDDAATSRGIAAGGALVERARQAGAATHRALPA